MLSHEPCCHMSHAIHKLAGANLFISGIRPIKENMLHSLGERAHTRVKHVFFCMAQGFRTLFLKKNIFFLKLEKKVLQSRKVPCILVLAVA